MDYKKIEIDGETFIKYGKKWVDSSFMVVPIFTARKIVEEEYGEIDFSKVSLSLLKEIIAETKEAECFSIALRAVKTIIQNAENTHDLDTMRMFLAVKTSCLRGMGDAHRAIESCKELKLKYGANILNTATLTSLAAAYCDIGDWTSALKTAKYAYAKQGGGVGYTNELSLVFKRIESNT